MLDKGIFTYAKSANDVSTDSVEKILELDLKFMRIIEYMKWQIKTAELRNSSVC